MPTLPTPSKRVAAFLERAKASHRGRIVFILDATGSRERAWDLASSVQADMFSAAAAFGSLDLQLVYFRGIDGECKSSPWTSDGREMARLMSKITCRTGPTQIETALRYVRNEHRRQAINAAVYVGDMCEESSSVIYDAASGLGVPLFVFGEGDDPHATPIFREMARLTNNGTTNGAYERFDPGAAAQLRELLRAVAAFATGGLTALQDLRTDSARKLLTQMKK